MLAPAPIASANYGIATKPSLGFEKVLYISTQNYTNPGAFLIVAANSGVATMVTADQVTLSGTPQELLVMLDTPMAAPAVGALTLTISGIDGNGAAGSWSGAFTPPAYALDQSYDFPQRFAVNLLPQNTTAATCKSISNISVTCDAGWVNMNLVILGCPSLSTFVKIGTRANMNLDPGVAMPTSVQDGKYRGRYIKPGEVDVVSLNLTVKEPTSADGVSRYRGNRVTGWLQETKESILNTQNEFLFGLIMTPKVTAPEGQEPNTLEVTALAERYASIPAH